MSLFAPKRLIIKPQSKHSKITADIIDRARKYDPHLAIEYLNTADFVYPVDTPREKFLYMKESAIISERSEDFIRTFDSPGNIVESLTTVLNLSWMCASNCEFCYLQTNQTPEHYFYTNLERAEHEIAASPAAHAAILTLWTHLSDYFGYRLNKLPDRFKETADWIRELYFDAHVQRDAEAVDRYYLAQENIAKQLRIDNHSYTVDPAVFRRDRATIEHWYSENLKYPLTLSASEFNDFLAVDHLTDNSAFLMRMIERYPRFKITIRSRSNFVDGFLRYDGQDRVRFNITLNTEHAINEFEHGTASLEERLHTARRIQEAKGYPLSLVLEPLLTYENYLDEYRLLIRRALSELDPSRIRKVILGGVRYADLLKAMIRLHFPDTKLFDPVHRFAPPVKPDTKNRYEPDIRVALYSALIAEIKSIRDIPIALGSETPELWESLHMSIEEELGNTVFEPIPGKPVPTPEVDAAGIKQPEPVPRETNGMDEKIEENPYWISIAPQNYEVITKILGEYDDYVPLDSFEDVVDELRTMSTVEEVPVEGSKAPALHIRDRWDSLEAKSLSELLKADRYFTPVRFIGRVTRVNPITSFELNNGTTSIVGIEITDGQGTAIETLDIQANCVGVDINGLHRSRTRCTFLGAIVPLYPKKKTKTNRPKPRFYLHDISLNVNQLDLVPWSPEEEADTGFGIVIDGKRFGVPKDHPIMVLNAHPEPFGVINYIKEEAAQQLGIQALHEAHELERALEFVILQALSQGWSERIDKLHGLVIGPPNVGKSYLTKAALVLNAVGQEISSSGRKVTVAGLVGTVKAGSRKNVSEPGILPSNSGGVVCIQEFHDVRGQARIDLCGVFVRMMEEGQVVESTTAETVHPTETSLLLDMNRYSQIHPDGEYNSFTDIDIPVNMLARFDYIVEIPRDEKRSRKTAEQMTQGYKSMGGRRPDRADPWELRLKYLVAFLKDQYIGVTIPEDVGKHIEAEVETMLAAVPPELQSLVEDMRLRIVRSALKLTKAVSTGNASEVASTEYADYALRFVQDKVNFIKSIRLEDVSEDKPSITDVEKRREILEAAFRGQRFDNEQVVQLLAERMEGDPVDKRTIQRDLKALGARSLTKPKGTWSLKRK